MPSLASVILVGACVAVLAVVVTLFAGLLTMVRGGAFNARWGNRLMRARVVSQACAIALIVLYAIVIRAG
jgi:hypothetical protein